MAQRGDLYNARVYAAPTTHLDFGLIINQSSVSYAANVEQAKVGEQIEVALLLQQYFAITYIQSCTGHTYPDGQLSQFLNRIACPIICTAVVAGLQL